MRLVLALLAAPALGAVVTKYSDLGGQPYALSRDARSLLVNGSRVLLLSGVFPARE